MKILTVSDRVEPALYDKFQTERFPDIDLILSCGDLPPEYLSFLVTMFNVPLFYVRGNHDFRVDGYRPEGCTNLDGKMVCFRGLQLMGFEGSNWYNGRPCQYTEKQMRRKIRNNCLKIWWHKGLDLIISHAPPRHIHDAEDPCHRGFECFRHLIDKYAPRFFVHGHMHFNYTIQKRRLSQIDNTKVINSYGYYIFEINNQQLAK